MFGRETPMVAMSHQYMLTERIPELEEYTERTGRKLPLLRDVDSSYYLRQEKFGLNLGPYERNCRAHWIDDDDPMPEDFSFQLYPDDLDRLERYIEDAMARVPLLATAGVSRVINGPIPYAPDGNPLIGPMPGVPDAFEACVFTFGVAQAGGAGKVLAEWLTEGATEWDMWSCDPRRFTDYADRDHAIAKGIEVYGHEYAMHFPHHAWPAGRDKRVSPVHDTIRGLGGQMGAYGGWERANWFARPGDDTSEEATQTWTRDGPWFPRVREECLAVRDAVGVLDLPGFSWFRLKGPGAADWLRGVTTGAVPRAGRMGLAYFADDAGRIVTEMSIVRLDEDEAILIGPAAAQWHDRDWLTKHLPEGSGVVLENRTGERCCEIVSGPNARALMAEVGDADLSLPWLTWQEAEIAGRKALVLRVSYAGALGWEIHGRVADTPAIYAALTEAGRNLGLRPFGMFALDSLRLEKGYRAWKGDLSTDYTVLEGGLERFVKWDKETFKGKRALENQRQRGVGKRFAAMIVDAGACDAPYMSTVWKDGDMVGETTSGGWGHRIGASIALGVIRADLAEPGTELEIEIYGERRGAVVQPDRPLFDPDNDARGAEADGRSSLQGAGRRRRRRRLRLLRGLPSRRARLDRRRPAGAQAAHLRHHVARRGPRGPTAPEPEHDPPGQVFGRPLRRTGARDRRRHGHETERLDHRGADRGAQGGNLPHRLPRPGLRRRGRRGDGRRRRAPVPASRRLRRRGRRPPAARRPVRPRQHRPGAGQRRAPERRPDRRGREGRGGDAGRRPGDRRPLDGRGRRRRRDRQRGRGELRGHVGARAGRHVGRQHPAARLRAFLRRHRTHRGAGGPSRCCACPTNGPTTRRTPAR